MEGVECPIDGCDYQGTPRSVESHISGRTDEAHSGEVGSAYRGRFGELNDDLEDDDQESEDVDDLELAVDVDDGQAGEPGIPIPVSSTTLIAGTLLLVVLVLAWSQFGGSDTGTQQQTSTQDTEQEQGLVP